MDKDSVIIRAKGLSRDVADILDSHNNDIYYWNYDRKYRQIKGHLDNLISLYEDRKITVIEFLNKYSYLDKLIKALLIKEVGSD